MKLTKQSSRGITLGMGAEGHSTEGLQKTIEIPCPNCEGRGFTLEPSSLSGWHWSRLQCSLCKGNQIVEVIVP